MRKIITVLILYIVLSSCTKNESDFLDFKLGMTKNEFKIVIDTLEKQEIIYQVNNGGYLAYRYWFNIDGEEISTSIYPEFDEEGLILLRIKIGEFTLPKNRKTGEVFFSRFLSTESENDKLFNLYLKKYGEPDDKKLWLDDKKYNKWATYTWLNGNVKIIFNYGILGQGQIEGSYIEYEFTDSFLKQRQNRLKSISNKKSIDAI